MNKPDVTKIVNETKALLSKRSPEILIGFGIAGMGATVVLAVRATPKAMALIEAEKSKRMCQPGDTPKLKPLEVVKVAWKPYISAAITGTVATACIIGASSVHVRRNAALAAAYKLSETALIEFKDKAVEVVGEKKVKEIKETISKDMVEKTPVSKSEVIITAKGNTLCFEPTTGRYFKSDMEHIRKIVNDLNARMISENSVSLTEFYVDLGLEPTTISDSLGWNLDRRLAVDFDSCIADDGTPAIVLNYMYPPFYDFAKYW